MGYKINIGALNNYERIAIYARLRKTLLNTKAVFSDETSNFRSPVEPLANEPVTVKLRVARNNIDKALLHTSSKFYEMKKLSSDYYFDYYGYTFLGTSETVSYYFEIVKDDESFFYNKQGISKTIDPHFDFLIIFDFKTPDWAKGAVMYQIFVDRFYNGDETNDVVDNEYIYLGHPVSKTKDWYKTPQNDDVRNFYGGDLQGVITKLPYLKKLGVEAIYLNPVFVSPSNHKYDIQDYDYIDPHFGIIVKDCDEPLQFEKFRNKYAKMYITRTGLKENLEAGNMLMVALIEQAHKNGIKVILDGVFNHCGAFNKWLDREGFYAANGNYPVGAYKDKNSIYRNYFKWFEDSWPNNDAYDSWWGHDNHPKLYYENSKTLTDYILSVGAKWVSAPFNADGWRLDVAADLGYSSEFNHQFWKDFRKAVKAANPNAIIIAEHYGRATNWLDGTQWDTLMNYDAFMEPITWFLTGLEKHSEEYRGDMLNNGWVFESSMRYNMATLNIQNLLISMNQLSNHDHSRFLTRTNMTVGRLHTKGNEAASEGINIGIFYEAVTFMMTWPGAPTVYYGDEAGLCGWSDPDNRRTYPWGEEDRNILEFHREIIAIRKKYEALRTGSLDYVFMEYALICFGRWDDDEKFIIILNNDNRERYLTAPVWKIGVSYNSKMERLILTTMQGFSTARRKYAVTDGQLAITLPPFSSIVLREIKV